MMKKMVRKMIMTKKMMEKMVKMMKVIQQKKRNKFNFIKSSFSR
jgi:hypothetical protein